jgi:tetratricopeptide (TPR) repeat protein
MSGEANQAFYKKLYYYVVHNRVSEPWNWSMHNLSPELERVLELKQLTDTQQMSYTNAARRWNEVEKDEFAYALFQVLFEGNYAALIQVALDNPMTCLEGFCWLLSYEESGHKSLDRLSTAAASTPFVYAKVVYGKYFVKERKYEEALKWFRVAALDHNEPSAWYEMGQLYEHGLGISEGNDPEYAFECFKHSAKLGAVIGMEHVARCYNDGIGTPKSTTKAIKWLERVPPHQQRHGALLTVLAEKHLVFHNRGAFRDDCPFAFYLRCRDCDCFVCRSFLYFTKRDFCHPKWRSRWDECLSRCVLVIICFRRRFGAKGVGKMVARHLWGTRADDGWKNKR